MSAWAAAERAVAESRVAPFEVHPPGPSGSHTSGAGPHSWGGVDAQQHAGAHAPWKREFHPPAVAERVVDAVTALVERSRHVPTAQDQRVGAGEVPVRDVVCRGGWRVWVEARRLY